MQVLDMKTQDGEELFSDDDDDYDIELGEGGEDELDEIAMMADQLTEKQKKKLEERGISIEEYLAGDGPDLSDDALLGEEGEDEQEEKDGEAGEKRAKKE